MANREALHYELLKFIPNVYFQPPADFKMMYPCITYHKTGKDRKFGNDDLYLSTQLYNITLIEHDPDSEVADNIEKYFDYCTIDQYFSADGLSHTTLELYY